MKRKCTHYLSCMAAVLALAAGTRSYAAVTSGAYNVGTGGDYATLSDAIADLNSSTITGNVIFNILPGTYSGSTWTGVINSISGASATNRVTIQPLYGAGTVSISSAGTSSSNYVLYLNNASYVTVRNLRLANTGTSYGRVVMLAGTASKDSVYGCKLTGATNTSTSTNRALVFADNANSMEGNVFMRDTLENGSHGVYWIGTGSSGSNGHVFDDNVFTNNYYSYIYTNYIGGVSIQNNIMTSTAANTTHYGIYADLPVNGMTVKNNKLTTSGTGGDKFGVYIYYGNYYTPNAPDLIVNNNDIDISANSGYMYGIYMDYYCYNMQINNNKIKCQTGSSYIYGIRCYYYCVNLECDNNELTTVNNGSYNYPVYLYYLNYGSQTGTHLNFTNNKVNATQNGTSGYLYALYMPNCYNMKFENNIVNATSKYYIYGYGPIYNCYKSNARNNTLNYTTTGSGPIYNYAGNVYNSSSTTDTFENNTINLTATSSGSVYNYSCYYIPTGSIANDNTYNMSVKNGTLYNYSYYGNGGLIQGNKFNMTSTTGTIYGGYAYNYASYSGASWVGNTFDMKSTGNGTIYGFGGYLPGQDKYMSNVWVTETGGDSYLWYESSSYGAQTDLYFFNNTFHSNATGSDNYLLYKAGGTSYSGKVFFYNNIFTKSSGSNTDGVYTRDTMDYVSDYNLYYSPNTMNFQNVVGPTVTTTSFDTWKKSINRDRNSVVYEPGYTDAAAKNFRPNPANPNSWAMHGRGIHMPGDTLDFDGNARPKTRQQGVPDLGAYEFTPSSIPPNCVAVPAAPVANTAQVFTFGTDTVASIKWGASVPATATMKQYTGVQAGPPMPGAVPRGYFYLDLNTGSNILYTHNPTVYYKNPWIGNISNEGNTKIARSTNGNIWEGYNFGNTILDSLGNTVNPLNDFDSTGKYTIVENARIGIRCVVNPENLKVANVTKEGADISWDPVFLPIGYQVIADNVPGTPASGAGAQFTSTNNISLTSLNENTDYYVHVRTICGPKDTSGWSTIYIKTLVTCHAPEVKVTALTQFRAVAYWDTVQTATRYEIAITNDNNPPSFGTPIFTTSQQIPIQQGREYFVWVKAYCDGSIYPSSDWGMAKFQTFPTSVAHAEGGVQVAAYPNPVKDVLNVSVDKPGNNATITITDLAGKVLYTKAITQAGITTADTRQLAPGLYLLKYADDQGTSTIKVQKL